MLLLQPLFLNITSYWFCLSSYYFGRRKPNSVQFGFDFNATVKIGLTSTWCLCREDQESIQCFCEHLARSILDVLWVDMNEIVKWWKSWDPLSCVISLKRWNTSSSRYNFLLTSFRLHVCSLIADSVYIAEAFMGRSQHSVFNEHRHRSSITYVCW